MLQNNFPLLGVDLCGTIKLMFGIIYVITNMVNGKQYVGQTTRTLKTRWRFHLRTARDGSTGALPRAIIKYGKSAFEMEQVDVAESQKGLNEREVFHVARLGTYGKGYNLTPGGGQEGISEETRKKMRDAKKHITEETRNKLSIARRRRPPASVETRQKQSESMQGYKFAPKQFCKRGHVLDEVNTYVRPFTGNRTCLTCFYLKYRKKFPEKLVKYLISSDKRSPHA